MAAPPSSVAPAMVPAVRTADARWDALLVCVAAYITISVGRLHQAFPVLATIRPALVLGIVSIALYVANARGPRAFGRLASPTTKYALLLLLWVAFSVPGALWQGESFQLLTDDFIKTIVMFLVIVGAARGPRDVERLAFVYFMSAVAYAVIVLLRFDLSAGARYAGLYYYDANEFATFTVTAIPLGLYFLLGQRRALRRGLGGAGLPVLALAFVRSGSRGGFLALLGVGVFFLAGYRSLRLQWRIVATVLLGLVCTVAAGDTYWERMQTILHPERDYNYTASGGRWQLWRRGIGYMLDHPLFGVGAGNFPTAEGATFSELQERGIGVKWSVSHNSFIQIGAELGVPGLVFFLGLIITSFGALRAVRRAESSVSPWARGPPGLSQPLMASLVGFVVGAVFLSLAYQAMLYTLAAFAIALRKVTLAGALATPRAGPVRRPWQR